MMKSILTTIVFLVLVVSGLAQTRSVIVNTSGVVQSPTNFWSADVTNARSGLGLGTAATNPATAFQPSSLALSNLASSNGVALTNLTAANITGTVGLASNVTGTIAIINGGSGATTAGGARTNLGLGTTNSVAFGNLDASFVNFENVEIGPDLKLEDDGDVLWGTFVRFNVDTMEFSKAISFNTTTNAATTRTNLGLGLSALTNTNTAGFNTSLYGSGTNPVLYNTNGEVVSPTNFWQVAPIVTRFVESQPTTNQTTNIVAARNLHIHSIAISTTNVTNTIALPTTNSFNGDIALVVHQGPTSSVTAVRTAGAATNLVTLNQFEQTVEFVFYDNVWQFNHNRSFIEPIFFSGTSATSNAAASRTNLGLGWLALTNPQSSLYSGTATQLLGYAPEIASGSTNPTGFNVLAYTNTNGLVIPANILIGEDQTVGGPRNARNVTVNGSVTIQYPFSSPTTIYGNNSITATDNSSYTNVIVSFASNSVGFSNVTASGTLTATSTITAKTNMVVEGFVDFTTNHTNNNPAAGANFGDRSRWLQVKIGTNNFYIPLFQ